jgi:hypothetical protein
MFRIEKVKDYSVLSKKAAMIIAAEITQREHPVLGLATGSTPIGAYQVLRELYREGRLDFSAVRTVNLDEYRGLSPEDSHSYRYFMNQELFHHINIDMEKTKVPNGLLTDANKACAEYEEHIRKLGGIHLQILGLGHDGHIGFNEPGDFFPNETHCVKLTEETIEANQRFFSSKEEVPKEAYTMGIGTIMKAKKILLMVSGKDKADILQKVLEGPVTPLIPASILQFHPHVHVLADEAALSKCKI